MTRLYFAYGSNLHPLRLAERVPSARPVGIARLAEHALRFHKHGAGPSGKCDVVPTAGGTVYGALFRLDEHELPLLDAAEPGYDRVEVRVTVDAGALDAFTYRAQPRRISPELRPYGWYRDLVLLGARHHGLPAAYLAGLEATAVRDDPDAARAAAMGALLARLRESLA